MHQRNPHKHSIASEKNIYFQKSEIEDILGTPFNDNNRVKLLKSGRATFQTIFDAVESAKNIICVEFYIFSDDYTGKKLAGLLKEKSRQGVKVYLLYDHFGSFYTAKSFWSDLKKAGIKIRISHPFRWSIPRSYIYRNHKKLLIIDGTKAFIGGVNIADEYHGHAGEKEKNWRDTIILLEGSIVSTLFAIFKNSWATWKGKPITCNEKNSRLSHGVSVIPIFAHSGRARRRIRRLYIHSFNNAKKNIFITTAYFNPGRRIMSALKRAAKRGVTIKLLLPGKSDVISVHYASRSYYRKLLNAGIHIYNYQGNILHSKTAVFDGCWSIIGSTNLDHQSLRRNDESNVGVMDHGFGRIMTETFQKDIKESIRIKPEVWARRPFHQKILERFFSFVIKKL
jgi:cardiolipin synthase